MFDQPPELSPDLEWMLQSGQASKAMLAKILVEEYYVPLYDLGLALLGNTERARRFSRETLSKALFESHRFNGRVSAQTWILRQALAVYRSPRRNKSWKNSFFDLIGAEKLSKGMTRGVNLKIEDPVHQIRDLLGEEKFLAVCLHYILEVETAQIAPVMRTKEGSVNAWLKVARQIYRSCLWQPKIDDQEVDRGLKRCLQRDFPALEASAVEQNEVRSEITHYAEAEERRQGRFTYFKELALVCVAILLTVNLMWGLARLSPDSATPSPGAATEVNTVEKESKSGARQPTPTVAPKIHTDLPERLDINSSPEDVKERISNARRYWTTKWQDVNLIFYGPPGYVGPPDAILAQIWLSKPNQTKMIAGPLGGQPDYIHLGRDEGFHDASIHNLLRWYYLTFGRHLALGTDIDTLLLPISRLEEENRSLRVRGIEVVANHQALVVDQVTQSGKLEYRLWVDTVTGVILRRRLYAQSDPEVVILEAITIHVDYDVNFPASTFEPESNRGVGLFARNYIGVPIKGNSTPRRSGRSHPITIWAPTANREPIGSFASPPPSFDPSMSRLTFQITPTFTSWEHQSNNPRRYAELFAGKYYLSSLYIGDPFSVRCDRSPNGDLLALSQGRTGQQREGSRLTWLNLSDAKKTKSMDFALDLDHFAFAPDNRRLAIFGLGQPLGSLYILDTDSGKLTKLVNIEYIRSMMWSPDGDSLAIISNWESPEYDEKVMVFDPDTGNMLNYSPYNYRGAITASELPSWIQRKTFPEHMGGLDACIAPPKDQIAIEPVPEHMLYEHESPDTY